MPEREEKRDGLSLGEIILGVAVLWLLYNSGTLSSLGIGGLGGSGGTGGAGGTAPSSGSDCGCCGNSGVLAITQPPILGVPTYHGPYASG